MEASTKDALHMNTEGKRTWSCALCFTPLLSISSSQGQGLRDCLHRSSQTHQCPHQIILLSSKAFSTSHPAWLRKLDIHPHFCFSQSKNGVINSWYLLVVQLGNSYSFLCFRGFWQWLCGFYNQKEKYCLLLFAKAVLCEFCHSFLDPFSASLILALCVSPHTNWHVKTHI